ncbi:MAG: tRNA (N6-isopentenyl adenosine(37)-C2)-methylthiotransferase MiaB [Gemmatimonas sp.]|jgi:tRNA-2-methylthio-N6-dimethylallyladenosine synthase|uniref:tRNA (N6-isopentenyl adenosine(37)-C2)-methylthiotransferase MiaB n=1 Tax=Gemmatimonas sp. TaxID=1962908 RepID=UPI0022CB539E|nr:tRNA (N6-isopentenyl adenosine(37)-C2)-methylthiotransferase MiaB [Gemmatimonas sp.]MCE2953577.1 tRNA (N6-isopentenyl adenosine(37)-C2)-methylthiotransferase MiaB [Gemmatimonas sp.]MCZ8010543.1 tRNA (N6-isopentenyl adenosine(37)-C2)-methylthiotransferase MiaB [Gemmatimonas sp.]MCZ8267107.1 tRNA (N6-isopentenyl adenosine(37)-C2)-methylthiotransferase MiaB [Gemmatimonas sp.]
MSALRSLPELPDVVTATPKPTVYIETYGCQMNVADSELMYGKLVAHGYAPVDAPDGADVILVNTCAIRENAETRVIGRLGELRRFMKPDTIVGVTGCMAQRLGARVLDQARHVSLVVGPDGYRALPALLDGARRGEKFTATDFDLEEHYEDVVARRFEGVKAWIPVQRGCDYRCTYCIVPFTRGPERSRKLADVVREVQQVVEQGLSEVVLLGQTVNSYHDGAHDFADLLRAVGTVDGIRRVRYTSPHPNDFSDRVIEAMATTPTVCEHVHLPMQSGSTSMLKRMLRRYSREDYLECVARMRAAIPGLALTTDIIVGFPGETDEEFEDTLSLCREVRFDDAFMFKFSAREGTPATRMPPEWTIPDDVVATRFDRLVRTVRGISRENNLGRLGETMELLIEKVARDGELLQGRSRDFKTVMVPADAARIGEYLTVTLTGTTGATFTGTPVTERRERAPLPMMGA